MYEKHRPSDIKEWIAQLIERGYFLVVVWLIDEKPLIDWCARN